MEIIHRCCCGIDVHAKSLVVCLIKNGKKQIRTYSTMTDDLLVMLDWLVSEGCQQVAIESTGVYWKPVFNILEGVLEVVLVNARHVKAVPGRKTDVRDCEWLADLLRHGLLRASFIPPLPIRELRELTRHRHTLVRDQTAVGNRIIKLAESANIKLAQVASNALGVSGRAMLRALSRGEEDATKMAELARGRLQAKQGQLRRALRGKLTRSQQFVLRELLDQLEQLEAAVARVSAEIREQIEESRDPFVKEAVRQLQTIPGVGAQVAEVIVSEIGTDMTRFPNDQHLSSWAGMCPGNNESAGKRKSGKTTKGSNYLRAALTQSAWAASHSKATYLSAQYRKLARRIGKKRALVAVGHSILVIAYHILKNRASYQELGGDYFDRQNIELQRARYISKLQALGLKVSVEPFSEAA
jgi:transposase